MADYPSDKKRDVGYKFSAGILSTDPDFSWFAEPFGLSPNQLAKDMWVQAVPYAASGGADTAISSISYITKKNIVLVLEPNTNGTLWLAREGGTLSGNRMRNFINPNNHTNAAGNISLGYTVLIFQSSNNGSAGTSITTTAGSWQFMYKEGAFITDDGVTPSDMGWNTTSTTSGESILHATAYQYHGLHFEPDNNPTNGDVLKYNLPDNGNAGYLEWGAGGSSGGEANENSFKTIVVSGQNHIIADSTTDTLTLVGGTNVTITTDNTTDTITFSATGGISLSDISVGAEGTPSGDGDISYDNTTGVITYTPPSFGLEDLTDVTGSPNPQIPDTFLPVIPTDKIPTIPTDKLPTIPTDKLPTIPNNKLDFGASNGTPTGVLPTAQIPNIDLTTKVTGTLPVTSGGTGLTDVSTLLNSNTTAADVGLSNVENKSSQDIRDDIVAGDIPNLAATKITSGSFDTARIPGLSASKITSHQLIAARGGTGISNFSVANYKNSNATLSDVGVDSVDIGNIRFTAKANISQAPKLQVVHSGSGYSVVSVALATTTTSNDTVVITVGSQAKEATVWAQFNSSGSGGYNASYLTTLQNLLTMSQIDTLSTSTVFATLSNTIVGVSLDRIKSDSDKLSNVASGATANATDSSLRDRSTHTGSQAISSITNLQTSLNGKLGTGDAAASVAYSNVTGKPSTFPPDIGTAANQALAGNTTTITSAQATDISNNKTKLSGIDNNATANDTDANLKNRANHTGSQAISTITNLQTELNGKLPNTTTTISTAQSDKLGYISVTGNVDLDDVKTKADSALQDFSTLSLSASDIPNIGASKITSGTLGVDRIPTITSAKISDVEIGSDKQDVASGITKVVTGDAVYNRANQDDWGVPEGTAIQSTGETGGTKFLREDGDGTCSWQTISTGGGGGATDIEDLDNVTKVGSYSGNDMLVYDAGSNSFKNTRTLSLQYASAIQFNGSFSDVSANVPNVLLTSVTENNVKHGIIQVRENFIIKLDALQASGTLKTFQIRNGADATVFVVDEDGGVRTNKYKDSSGNDKIEYETDKVKIHEDIKAVTGKFKDNSDVTRIDYSGTVTKISGDVQHTGGSPATISGPDADKLKIESTDDLDFKIASAGASSKSFKFYNNTTEVAKIEHDGAVHGKNFTFNENPGRIYDSSGNIPMYFDSLGGSYITGDLSITSLKSSSDMVFQVDHDEGSTAGSNSFQFKNGAGTEIANLNESGDLQIDGDLTLSGLSILNGDNEVTISVDADQNAIFNGAVRVLTGTFKNLMGNTCITMDGSTTDVSVASKLTTGGNIELGHASDTTIARSAAGTVTIEGKEVVTKNKIYDFKVCTYWSSSTAGIYIPFGGTLNESTTLTNNTYSTIYSAPYDGRVVRITSKEQNSASGTSTLELYLNHSSTQTGTDMSVNSFTSKFNQDCPSDWTFSAGDTIAIKRTDTSASYGTSLTVVFEFDAT